MPISVGIAGYDMTQHERIAAMIAAVGGPVRAAALVKKSRTHIDNMRKPDAPLRLEDLLPLCLEAGVSLDWVATGYQTRPDLGDQAPGFATIEPLRPGDPVAPLAFDMAWLDQHIGLHAADHLRLAVAEDGGMEPLIGKGATVLVDIRPGALRLGVYLVGLDDEQVARRVSKLPGGRMELIADGDPKWRYDLQERDRDMLTLHRIVWTGRTL